MSKKIDKTSPLRIAVLGHETIPRRQGGIEIVVEELTVRMATDVLWSRNQDCWGSWIRQHKKTFSRLCDEHRRN